jgi:hypothetical protein
MIMEMNLPIYIKYLIEFTKISEVITLFSNLLILLCLIISNDLNLNTCLCIYITIPVNDERMESVYSRKFINANVNGSIYLFITFFH